MGLLSMPVGSDESIDLDAPSFEYIKDRIYELAGISLAPSKKELVQTRIRKRLAALQLRTYADYVQHLKALSRNDAEWQTLINALTTNKTDFFREMPHFDFIEEKFLPAWRQRKSPALAVWSAACSTGEEPYSIAMTLSRALEGSGKKFAITASDIDTNVLSYAQRGVYQKATIAHLPEHLWMHGVDLGREGIADWFRIKPSLKDSVTFHQTNLVYDKCPWPEAFDIIFCRNVLIYFAPETIKKTIDNLYQAAKPGGLLFIGHTESIHNIASKWEPVSPSVYRKPK